MPPFVPRKRVSSEDPPNAKRRHAAPAPSDESNGNQVKNEENDSSSSESESSSSDEVDWEDAINTIPPAIAPSAPIEDLELTLDKNEAHVSDLLTGKKAPSKIERQIRIQTHCLHVEFLLYHNALRNYWANDPQTHDILRRKLPPAIQKEITKWRIASGLEQPPPKPSASKKTAKGKQRRKSERDWSEDAARMEPGQPDMSRGDPIIPLLRVLTAYWKKQFKITAPGLRKHGYRPMAQLEAEISAFNKEDPDPERHGEKIQNLDGFRQAAERMEGSRDLGAQLFTALLRAISIEARLVASLQPLGFGWTKAETYTPPSSKTADTAPDATTTETGTDDVLDLDTDSSDLDAPRGKGPAPPRYDRDLPFPIYWAEVASPITHEIIPVDPLVLQNPVASTPELQAAFEPRGAKAERAKQVIAYVVAYAADKTAKDVTTRYLRRRTWPGKTKGFRMPVEKIPIPGRKGKFYELDWFRIKLHIYRRPPQDRTAVDDIEEAKDLVPNQPEKKAAPVGDTLQSLRSSEEFILPRFLRREEALRPDAQPVRTFTSGKGAKAKEEPAYRRADVLKCLSAESWHKEGRQIKRGETALKHVPIRAVTLLRKREVDELTRETGQKPQQGLYARHQTEWIIPPPIRDGIIPKNDYGNIDCFVPRMVPRGAAHVPWPGTVRLCKKLNIDYAEAVTGFEFGSKMAVPVIQGVVVAAENEDLLKDAWRADAAEKRRKDHLKAEARILQTWRKFLYGLRIAERVREEYGPSDDALDRERDTVNPFASSSRSRPAPQDPEDHANHADHGGGFLLPGEDEADNNDNHGGGFLLPGEEENEESNTDPLLLEQQHHHHHPPSQSAPKAANETGATGMDISDDSSLQEISPPPEDISSEVDDIDKDDDDDDDDDDDNDDDDDGEVEVESEYEPPSTRRRTRSSRR
ncbi:Rad4 family protein [Aspergillus candidus]|uniref:Rad4-domain-containing protein n=1 Tax=Aspergillus candidus TaxID=41067 RepID=A0A2I2F0L6_ASPCN|nr:Rad4-domain-containing protein [Aspergillus candidus]PLB34169.1 Rad4-domain-containing protein [Aspergillus candidus]